MQDFAEANLFEADLRYAILKYVDLSKANLSRAYLYDADLSDADLSGANFSRQTFPVLDFSRSDVPVPIFLTRILVALRLVEVDLRSAKDLEIVNHGAPSYIDINTIVKIRRQHP